jgi:hypothetical protein
VTHYNCAAGLANYCRRQTVAEVCYHRNLARRSWTNEWDHDVCALIVSQEFYWSCSHTHYKRSTYTNYSLDTYPEREVPDPCSVWFIQIWLILSCSSAHYCQMRGAKLLQEYAEIGTVRMCGKEYIYIIIVLDCVVGSCSDSEFNVPTLQVDMFGPACCLHACLPVCGAYRIYSTTATTRGREEFPQASVATPT